LHLSKKNGLHLEVPEGRRAFSVKSWIPESERHGASPRLAGHECPCGVGNITSGPPRVMCVGPAEWLLIAEEAEGSMIPDWHASDLEPHGLAVVEVTDALAVVQAAGPSVREYLAKSCGLDFHARCFGQDHCARTRFAGLAVVVDCREASRFDLYVARSTLAFLVDWLEDAAVEFPGT
jgi:sarcosine oxidase, subunit gamma